MNVLADHSLQQLNTLGFPSVAQYFIQIDSEADLLEAVAFAKAENLKIHVLSGGSNILIAPRIEGVVLFINIRGIELHNDALVTVNAGENWHDFVGWSIDQGLSGIESMALIPGKVGAAPVQNIGAYGTELCDVAVCVRAFDLQHERFVRFDNLACEFAYRDSLFKRTPGRYVITQVTLQLARESISVCRYKALSDALAQQGELSPSPKQVFETVIALRQQKLPDPAVLGNAGSFFKNPVVSQAHYETLHKQYPKIVAFPSGNGMKLAAGWLIDKAGWKGYQEGCVGVHQQQALVLTHTGGGEIDMLLQLAECIRESISKTYGVSLEVEPQRFPL